jgi:signal transduction histidine kinase
LLAGSAIVVALLVIAIVTITGTRLDDRLTAEMQNELRREARLIAQVWTPRVDADSLADAVGGALGRRVTLIRTDGVVLGDSDFDDEGLRRMENHSAREEITEAMSAGSGCSARVSPSAGDEEMYCAVRTTLGASRVSIATSTVRSIVWRARRDVVFAGLLAMGGALLLAWVFSRSVSRPIVDLRNVAQAIATGDLARRPTLSAPGEVGDLADALHRMAEQLAGRLSALEREDVLLLAILDSLDEGVIAVSPQREVVRMNASARRILGVTEAPPFAAERLPSDRPLRDALRSALAGQTADPVEFPIGDRTISIGARPLATGGAVLTAMDLTARKRLETIRRDFVANVSHELKTPLTVIAGYAETLIEPDVAPEDRARFTETIVASARRMQRIVDDLLDLSRYESGGWVPNRRSVSVAATIQDVLGGARGAADRQAVHLDARVDPGAESLDADPTALRQIIANLVDNAIRHTRDGSVTVIAEPEGEGVSIAVRDSGEGIPPEHLSRVFERFYRVDTGRGRDTGGTGLGLAIVKHLVEAHGGRVAATSVVGRGTTVTAWFPSSRSS